MRLLHAPVFQLGRQDMMQRLHGIEHTLLRIAGDSRHSILARQEDLDRDYINGRLAKSHHRSSMLTPLSTLTVRGCPSAPVTSLVSFGGRQSSPLRWVSQNFAATQSPLREAKTTSLTKSRSALACAAKTCWENWGNRLRQS